MDPLELWEAARQAHLEGYLGRERHYMTQFMRLDEAPAEDRLVASMTVWQGALQEFGTDVEPGTEAYSIMKESLDLFHQLLPLAPPGLVHSLEREAGLDLGDLYSVNERLRRDLPPFPRRAPGYDEVRTTHPGTYGRLLTALGFWVLVGAIGLGLFLGVELLEILAAHFD